MSYNYLGLVNELNRRVNEVELNADNFVSAKGFYSTAKDAVNTAIRHINQDDFYWPFNFVDREDVLVPGTMRYNLPNNLKIASFETFRIKRDDTLGNKTQLLQVLDYEEYLEKYIDDEYNTSNTGIRTIPRYIVRTPSQEYVVYPSPDKAYTLAYEYYSLPVDLVLPTDVPTIPEFGRNVIIDGAMYYVYSFRGDTENTDRSAVQFKKSLNHLRTIYVNRHEYARDTRVRVNQTSSFGPRVS